MEHPNNTKDSTMQDVKSVPTQDSAPRESVNEGQIRRGVPELLRDMSEEQLEAASRKLVRKLDLRLMGPLILMYIMNYLDRSAFIQS